MQDAPDILADLLRREPIFHRPEFPTIMADDFFEIGASGKRYNRDFLREHLAANPPIDASAAGWKLSDPELRPISADTFLLTYTLDQCPRMTRRATLWKLTMDGWQILYHQGTIVG